MSELFTNIDQNLHLFITEYQQGIYFILFLIIFIKTGIGILSFVPGESLLLAVGVILSQDYLEPHFSLILLTIASILGNIFNYITGKYLGIKIIHLKIRGKNIISPLLLEKSQKFYYKHGAKTIILIRFIPMLRSLAPFSAGMSKMNFHKFLIYSTIGGFIWITTYLYIGYFFGNIFH